MYSKHGNFVDADASGATAWTATGFLLCGGSVEAEPRACGQQQGIYVLGI